MHIRFVIHERALAYGIGFIAGGLACLVAQHYGFNFTGALLVVGIMLLGYEIHKWATNVLVAFARGGS